MGWQVFLGTEFVYLTKLEMNILTFIGLLIEIMFLSSANLYKIKVN